MSPTGQSPFLQVSYHPAHLSGGDGGVWLLLLGAMGRRDETRVASVRWD